MKIGNTYTCPKCNGFLAELVGDTENSDLRLRTICKGKCGKSRTVRVCDGSLVGESAGRSTIPQPLHSQLAAA